jgi:hypothetical protein
LSESPAANPDGAAARVLFVPVSGPYGMGEYARSLAIARALSARRPGVVVHFLLSGAAPYARGTPFAHTLLPSSPTFHTPEVLRCLREFRPDLVIFDNAGRSAQRGAARRCGAKLVFISARRRQRAKAFRFGWMRLLDEHWIAYPQFTVGAPGPWERCKLDFLGRPRLRYLDVIFSAPDGRQREAVLADLGVATGAYALVVPGGGTGHPRAADAVAKFFEAACLIAAAGLPTVFVGPAPVDADPPPGLQLRASLPQAELAALMLGSRLVIANGGSTLLQAIACGAPCLAGAIAGDQAERIRRCVDAAVAREVPLEAQRIAAAALDLSADAAGREALRARSRALGLADGVAVALAGIDALLPPAASRSAGA